MVQEEFSKVKRHESISSSEGGVTTKDSHLTPAGDFTRARNVSREVNLCLKASFPEVVFVCLFLGLHRQSLISEELQCYNILSE